MMLSASYHTDIIHFADSLPVGIIQHNTEGEVVFCNNTAEKILGLKADQFVGKMPLESLLYFVQEDGSRFSGDTFPPMVTLKTGYPQRNVIIGIKRPGDIVSWLCLNSVPLFGDNKIKPVSAITILNDITEKKISEKILADNERKFRQIFNSTNQFIGLLSAEGIVIEANKTALDFANLTPEDTHGKLFWESYSGFFSELVMSQIKEDVKNAAAGNPVRYTAPLVGPDASLHWIDFSLKPVFDSSKMVAFIIAEGRDVTETVVLQKKYQKEQLENQKEVLRATIDAQENERNEIGKELHDNINQMLASVKLLMESYQEKHDPVDMMLSKGIAIVEECIEEIRQLSGSLVSPKVQKVGLREAVKAITEIILTTRKCKMNLLMDETLILKLTDQQTLAVYRIIQEQLNNIVKHSEANNITIKLFEEEERAVLKITDDGKGFDPGVKSKGIGLRNMENRIDILNGDFSIISGPGQGCTIAARFPLVKL